MSQIGADQPKLAAPRADALHLLAEQIRRGHRLLHRCEVRGDASVEGEYRRWRRYNERLLRFVLAAEQAPAPRPVSRRARVRQLLGTALANDLRAQLLEVEAVFESLAHWGQRSAARPRKRTSGGRADGGRVLVVHGRNEAAREKVARFLIQLGFEPVLLSEVPGQGRTLIEKLEGQSSIAFAVVLLTGDDAGKLTSPPERLRPRARQNVILELGFALGRLGRERVCALYEEGVELPSDYRGVEYAPLDPAGAWRARLAKELHVAGLRFDPLNAL
jgi:predicted nucleotide-binding protein